MSFPFYRQYDMMDCGPTCIRMIAASYGRRFSLQGLREKAQLGKTGVNLLGISQAAEQVGFRTLGAKIPFETLKKESHLPCIAHWDQDHFVVVYKISKKKVYVADPSISLLTYSHSDFMSHWATSNNNGVPQGVALLLEPTPKFYETEDEKTASRGIRSLLKYMVIYKRLILQLVLGLLAGSLLQLIFPLLTRSIVDTGINNSDIPFIYLLILAQAALYIGRTGIEFIRGWILLHIGARVNISILSDFLVKLMRLPMGYFDTKLTGDILQRMSDHERIQSFLTTSTLSTLFSFINLIIFGVVLAVYSLKVFAIFLIGSISYFLWVMMFMSKRRELDFKRFELSSKTQSKTIQLILGMQEIKLNNNEQQKRWEWERLQVKLFKWNVKSLALGQNQQAGALFLNEGKNIAITLVSAIAVVNNEITLGTMLAIQYITGQLNSPIEQLIQFIKSLQDARISMERLNEIHVQPDEEPEGKPSLTELPDDRSLEIKNLSFRYPGAGNKPVLKNINLTIAAGKTTAIVGMSGSGKSTLLKLLLKYYPPQEGSIKINNFNLEDINHTTWRQKCGVVTQEGFIFSDTIANNIALDNEAPDINRLIHATQVACIDGFISDLPLGFNTRIGSEGSGISQGQRQRILIARSVYKNPEYIFFDEATNALDANNERSIMANLNAFFKGRTAVVVAHRLSTVKNADLIVVLNNGEITERGTHDELIALRQEYFNLVKNQLELDK
jgi:ATP-binding cassette, subfamily B, bacterial